MSGRYFTRKKRRRDIPFFEAMENHLKWSKSNKKPHSSRRDLIASKHLNLFFKELPIHLITPDMVETYRNKRKEESAAGASVNRELACLKRLFNIAIRDGKIRKNPVKGVKFLQENQRDRVLNHQEYKKLISVAKEHIVPIIKVGYWTGMRKGEILNLKWTQVDLKAKRIYLRAEDTKTNQAREIPLSEELVRVFENLQYNYNKNHVFTYKGKDLKSFRRAWASACSLAGISDFTFHDLRHTAATNFRKAGVRVEKVMRILGHKSVAAFLRYQNVGSDELDKAMEKLIKFTNKDDED